MIPLIASLIGVPRFILSLFSSPWPSHKVILSANVTDISRVVLSKRREDSLTQNVPSKKLTASLGKRDKSTTP